MMGMRRETRASKGNNRLSIETDTMDDTKHLGSGKIVEELETVETLKIEITSLKKKNISLLSEVKELNLSMLSLGTAKDNEIERLNTKIKKLMANGIEIKRKPPESTSDEMLVYKNKDLQSVNAVKLFNAIKSEEKNQGRKDVKLSRKDMVDIYSLNESKVTKTRDALSGHGFIGIIKEGPNKYRYKILKVLPTL